MAIPYDKLVFERPQRPAPIPIEVERPLDRFEVMIGREHPQLLQQRLKADMAREVARHIIDHCQVFQMPDLMAKDPVIRMSFVLHDEGGLRNWLPRERGEGRVEGRKQAIEALPYGLDPDSVTSEV